MPITRPGPRHGVFTSPAAAIRVPGDDIVGIVTTGKGVTIHGRDCQTLDSFAATPERFIDVDWNYEWRRGGRGRQGRPTRRGSA